MSAKGKKSTSTKTKAVSESKPAAPELLLELLAGKEGAALARPFLPDENEIEVILERNGNRKIYPLFEVCCILLKDDPNHLSTLQNSHDLMEIETLCRRPSI